MKMLKHGHYGDMLNIYNKILKRLKVRFFPTTSKLDFDYLSGRYQRTLMFSEKPPDLHTVYIRLGSILLSEGSEVGVC
jgi:hypothetical protein